VLASLIFAGMSGSAIADIAGTGRIQIRMMTQGGFSIPFSAAVTAVSATIGPILPPSIIMVVYGAMAQVSIGSLFLSGVTPAFILAGVQMAIIYILSRRHPEWKVYERAPIRKQFSTFLEALPALMTPAILLGGFLTGFWTPTEAGVVAAVWAFLVARFVYHDIGWSALPDILGRTAVSTGNILLIFSSAHVLSQIVALEGLPAEAAGFMQALTDNPLLVLLVINIVMFMGGMFLEPTPFLLVSTPFLIHLCGLYGFDPVHIGLVCVVNLMLGTITPPFAIALFAVMDIVRTPFHVLVRATLPFYMPFLLTILVVTYFPTVSMWLPRLVFGQ
jgi:tripartite ATP-independent transporter DctM subunit